eukprot:746284-Hanusia_phi.AAC.2
MVKLIGQSEGGRGLSTTSPITGQESKRQASCCCRPLGPPSSDLVELRGKRRWKIRSLVTPRAHEKALDCGLALRSDGKVRDDEENFESYRVEVDEDVQGVGVDLRQGQVERREMQGEV